MAKAASKTAATTEVKRERVKLPETVASQEAEWPGSSRGRKASPIRNQIMADLQSMDHGSVRRYDIAGAKEQGAFLSLFRKCVDETFVDENDNPAYGVQTHTTDDAVFVKIGDRRERNAK